MRDYTSTEICTRVGPLSTMVCLTTEIFTYLIDVFSFFQCNAFVHYDIKDLLKSISKSIDPHQVCSIIDICPKTNAFENVSKPTKKT